MAYVSLFAEVCLRFSLITCKTSSAVLDKALDHSIVSGGGLTNYDHSQNIRIQDLTTKVVVKNKNNKRQLN